MRIQVVAPDLFSATVADIISQHFCTERSINVCFTAGRTPDGSYAELARRYKDGVLDSSNVVGFTLDEYAGVSKTHPRSCFMYLKTHLYDPLGISMDQIVTYSENISPQDAVTTYEQAVIQKGGFSLSILGIGLNGHVGFNEPGTPFDSRTHVTPLAETTIERARREGWTDVPGLGLTLGIGTLMESEEVLLIANGSHKADIVEQIVHGDISIDIPASCFRNHPNSLLLLDDEAASRL